MIIDYGGGMIFPDSWAGGPPDPPEPRCEVCGDTGEVVVATFQAGDQTGETWGPCLDCPVRHG